VKFIFVVNTTISLATQVEADTLEQAIEAAKSRGPMSLCSQCAPGADEWGTSGELDCEPGMSELVDLHVDGDATAGPKLFDRACELWEES
jgi:hypothetical protein